MSETIDTRLKNLGITLPEVAVPVANYVGWTLSGNTLYISGQLPVSNGTFLHSGHLGANVSIEDGAKAARQCAINILAQVKNACTILAPNKGLEAVKQVLKLEGLVSAIPEFKDHPKVINGASDLMVEVFADKGKHSRVAYGVSSLPLGVSVEISAIFELSL